MSALDDEAVAVYVADVDVLPVFDAAGEFVLVSHGGNV